MELLAFLITIIGTPIGIGISLVAMARANNAKMAVAKALGDRNTQDDLVRLRGLLVSLIEAKEAVSPWVSGMPPEQRQGRIQEEDLAKLHSAVDQLRTKSPIGAPEGLRRRISKSANVLDNEFRAIAEGESNEDHWKAALSEIQQMIPKLEQAEREIRDNQILDS